MDKPNAGGFVLVPDVWVRDFVPAMVESKSMCHAGRVLVSNIGVTFDCSPIEPSCLELPPETR